MRLDYAPTARYTLLQGTYWASYCAILTFSSVYLLARGLSNAQIGLLLSIAGALSALLQPFVSRIADGLRRMSLRQFTALLVLGQLAVGALLPLAAGRLPHTVLYGLLIILVNLVMPLISALGMACIDSGRTLNFGAARAAGSITYGICSAVFGRMVLRFGEGSLPVGLFVLDVLLLVSVLLFRFAGGTGAHEARAEDAAPAAADRRPFPLRYRHAVPLLLGVILLFISHNVLNVYAFQIVLPLGGDSAQMGTMLLIQSLMELPVMFAFAWMLRRADSRVWMRLSGIGFFLHALGTLLANSMGFLYAVQVFQMNGYALYILAYTYYVNDRVRPNERVQGQAWFAMAITLGSVLASLCGGTILDLAGARLLLGFATVTGGAGMALLWVLLRRGGTTLGVM